MNVSFEISRLSSIIEELKLNPPEEQDDATAHYWKSYMQVLALRLSIVLDGLKEKSE